MRHEHKPWLLKEWNKKRTKLGTEWVNAENGWRIKYSDDRLGFIAYWDQRELVPLDAPYFATTDDARLAVAAYERGDKGNFKARWRKDDAN